ncbi:MAG: hypothetical protein RLZZ416_636 [Candidatus Parcubacteria bacterium]
MAWRILLVGRDTFLLRNTLQSGGFVSGSGFEMIEAGGIDAALRELKNDDSIVAVVVSEAAQRTKIRADGHDRAQQVAAFVNNAHLLRQMRNLRPHVAA